MPFKRGTRPRPSEWPRKGSRKRIQPRMPPRTLGACPRLRVEKKREKSGREGREHRSLAAIRAPRSVQRPTVKTWRHFAAFGRRDGVPRAQAAPHGEDAAPLRRSNMARRAARAWWAKLRGPSLVGQVWWTKLGGPSFAGQAWWAKLRGHGHRDPSARYVDVRWVVLSARRRFRENVSRERVES